MAHTSEIDEIPARQVDQVVQDFKDAGATSVTKTPQADCNFSVVATFDGGAGTSSEVEDAPKTGTNTGQTPVVQPALPAAPVPGHMVTIDPPYSVTGRATMFGLDWGGSVDEFDNGIGFFINPATGQPYDTRNKGLVGCSLPREVMLSTFLSIDSWKAGGIDHIWDHNGLSVQKYVEANKPLITLDSGGKTAANIPLVDAGPAADTGNAIDLTYAVAHQLDTQGAALATYEILVDGKPIEIKGWNWNKGIVG